MSRLITQFVLTSLPSLITYYFFPDRTYPDITNYECCLNFVCLSTTAVITFLLFPHLRQIQYAWDSTNMLYIYLQRSFRNKPETSLYREPSIYKLWTVLWRSPLSVSTSILIGGSIMTHFCGSCLVYFIIFIRSRQSISFNILSLSIVWKGFSQES